MKAFKKFVAALVILAFTSNIAMAYVTPGDLNRLRGLAMTLVSATITTLTSTTATITTVNSTTQSATTQNIGASGTAGTLNIFPTTAANGILKLLAVNNSGAFNSTISNSNIGQATVYSLPDAGAATANFVVDTATQTVTNKTMTAPVINNPVVTGPAPVACGSTCTLGAANKGTYTRLDTAGGSAATLPAATGSGTVYSLYISVATTSAQDKILLATVTDTIIGTARGENAGTAKVFVGNAGTYHSIQMPFAGSQPSGGFIGDSITCTDVASTIYKCDIMYQAGTTPTTPYNAGTT